MVGGSTTYSATTLLGRLASGFATEADWREFVDRYGPYVLAWCRANGCPGSEVEDVLQEVLIKLMRALPTFRYNPELGFRAWLATITQHAVIDLVRSRQRRVQGSGDTEVWMQLQAVPADDLSNRLQEAFERELLDQAYDHVRCQVSARAWQTFELTCCQRLPAAESAQQLGMKTSALYVARARVIAKIAAELKRLKNVCGGDS